MDCVFRVNSFACKEKTPLTPSRSYNFSHHARHVRNARVVPLRHWTSRCIFSDLRQCYVCGLYEFSEAAIRIVMTFLRFASDVCDFVSLLSNSVIQMANAREYPYSCRGAQVEQLSHPQIMIPAISWSRSAG